MKRAYASRLKDIKSDDDRDAFMALRSAYERARTMAERGPIHAPKPPPEAMPEAPPYGDGPAPTEPEPAAAPAPQADAPGPLIWRPALLRQVLLDLRDWYDQPDRVAADTFFADVARVLSERELDAFVDALLGDVAADGEWPAPEIEDERDGVDPPLHPPYWMDGDTIVALHRHIAPHARPMTTWVGRHRANRFAEIAEPVLLAEGVIHAPLPRQDAIGLYGEEVTRERADAHGSYFDPATCQWVDLSPVPRVLRELDEMIAAGHPLDLDAVAALLDRDELQPIDAFLALDEGVRSRVYAATTAWVEGEGLVAKDLADWPTWLSPALLVALARRFSWYTSVGRFERRRAAAIALQKILATLDHTGAPEPAGFAPFVQDPSPRRADANTPERLPFIMTFTGLMGIYLGWRVFVLLVDL